MKHIAASFMLAAILGAGCTELIVRGNAALAEAAPAASGPAIDADIDLSAIDPTVNACQNFYKTPAAASSRRPP